MPRLPADLEPQFDGLRGWLIEHEKQALAAPHGCLDWQPDQPAHWGCLDRLAALLAGQEMSLPIHSCRPGPGPAMGGVSVRSWAPTGRWCSGRKPGWNGWPIMGCDGRFVPPGP